jgi:hypothetical protein
MSANDLDTVVGTYLERLDLALSAMPAPKRDQLVEKIAQHVAEGRRQLGEESPAALLQLLDRIGRPEDIAAGAERVEKRIGIKIMLDHRGDLLVVSCQGHVEIHSGGPLRGGPSARFTPTHVTPTGRLVHPSWWQWPLWVCFLGLFVGAYIVLTTYHDRFPMFGRARAVDHSSRFSLGLNSVALTVLFDPAGTLAVRVGLDLISGGSSVIEVHLDEMDVQVMGRPPDNNEFSTRDIRILPSRVKQFRSSFVSGLAPGTLISGEISYTVTYGPAIGFPRYRRKHKVGFGTLREITAIDMPSPIDWWDLAPETDEDV